MPRRPLTESAGGTRLFAQQHMATPILLMAGFVMVGTEWAVFAIGYNRHLFWAHTQIDQEALGCLGPFFSQHEIVVVGATLITMSGNLEERFGVVLQPPALVVSDATPSLSETLYRSYP